MKATRTRGKNGDKRKSKSVSILTHRAFQGRAGELEGRGKKKDILPFAEHKRPGKAALSCSCSCARKGKKEEVTSGKVSGGVSFLPIPYGNTLKKKERRETGRLHRLAS